MIDNRKDMSCEEFSATMADLIAAGEDIFAHPHVRKCKLHRALLDDLEAIALAARELLRDADPPDRLWNGIQARLGHENQPILIVSDVTPGYRVVFAMKAIESYNPHASPPPLEQSLAQKKLSTRLKIIDVNRTSARREGRR
jgi:hypothetical protein